MSPLVNVTLPVYNEAAQLEESVRRLERFLSAQPQGSWELVIAENGSTDGTREIAEQLARGQEARGCLPVRVMHLDQAGRGRALRASWLASEADILSYMDVDLSTDLACFPALIEAVASGRCDIAVGSRLLPDSQITRGWKREVLSRCYNLLLRAALGLRVRDAQCGFKALTRRAARALLPRVRDDGWFFDTELLFRAQREGWRIEEIPVRWVDDPGTTVKLLSTIGRDLRGVWRLWRER